ncbi:MAG: trimethylamine-N-oxide reductase [Sulfobacillus acidophilus]|uniref:Trimethylamine-N-oxide reductase n=1 Tax=Sulfobacillus acidophilus TaxID=53633 RepID=A0A2T2WMQ8_9FIRM|nr:MAG: trimethylamine-N-oxide reductase [Sulfobacillus acidophilus]
MAVRMVHAVCPHDCYDACGLEVSVEDGQVTAIHGDPDHPITNGFLCFKVNHYLDRLYHSDRVTQPLKRVGPKGGDQFRPVSWDEALSEVGTKLNRILAESGGEAILPYTFAGNEGLLSHSLSERFFRKIGASRLQRTICTAAADAALNWVYGTAMGPDPETLPLTKFVILWGSNPMATNIHEIPLLDEARRRGAEIWTIDPLKTATAKRYDHHVTIQPGSDGALALGLARAILERQTADMAFIRDYVTGFEQFRAVADSWTLDRTLATTGLTRSQFGELLERLESSRPLLFRTGWGLQRRRTGAQAVWAISALSIILGAPRHRGGGHLVSNSGAFPLNWAGLWSGGSLHPTTRSVNMVQLGEALTALSDPPIRSLIVYGSNPAVTAPQQQKVLEGLRRPDLLTIVHEQMMTDTARYADWVFPACMSVEALDLYISYWHRYVQLSLPAVAPLGESVSNNEFFRRLAKTMGLTDPELQESDEGLIRTLLQSNHPWLEGISWDALVQHPVQKLKLPTDTRPYVDTAIPTRDERLHIEPFFADAGRIWQDQSSSPDEFQLLSPARRETIKSSYANVRSVMKTSTPELLMHPEDLRRLRLQPGQWVSVYNAFGETRMVVQPSEVPPRGIVVSYAVHWNDGADGSNVNQLTSATLSDYGQGATFYDAWVRIRS